MTFEEYLSSGGDREEKLVTIYKVAPEKLSDDYLALFRLIETPNHFISIGSDHVLAYHLSNWDRIKKDLVKQGADFV